MGRRAVIGITSGAGDVEVGAFVRVGARMDRGDGGDRIGGEALDHPGNEGAAVGGGAPDIAERGEFGDGDFGSGLESAGRPRLADQPSGGFGGVGRGGGDAAEGEAGVGDEAIGIGQDHEAAGDGADVHFQTA